MNFLIIARPCPTCANASPRWAMARSSCRRCWDGSRRRWGKPGGKPGENPMKIHQTIQKSHEKNCLRWFPGGFWDGFDGFSWDFAGFRRETNDWRLGKTSDSWWDFEWVWLNFTIRQTSTLKWLWPAGSAVMGNTPGLGSDVHPRAHRQRGALSRDGLAGCREGVRMASTDGADGCRHQRMI